MQGNPTVFRIFFASSRLWAKPAFGVSRPILFMHSAKSSLSSALSIASSVANQSPGSIAQCKELIHKARLSNEPYQEELEPFVNLFDTKDQKEGVEAFLDKRKPNWQNA